ncbi:MAG TPA: LPS export ABC transporter periplasmic protein LptC [Candidatus Cloacimonadota bacterium]|nr:LPS export ABC transporter periplasmic protein LptC [Candidatus Cloacimonadota bacterium]HOD54789.1 LPS export ABC transporter periplasmic protein LptC [Candidatus Cloacimonadota bacterium]
MKAVLRNFSFIWMLISLALISACDLSTNIQVNTGGKDLPATEIIDSVFIVATNGEALDWKLNAKKVERYPDSQVWKAWIVRFESLPPDQSQKTIMTCNEAQIDEISNVITGKGNVEIKSPNGYLRTELLIFNRFSNELNAPQYVYMERGGNVIKGTGLTTNINFDYVNLQKVSGQGSGSESLFE